METNKKFRNHISIIFENVGKIISVIFFIFVGNFVTSMEETEGSSENLPYLFLVVGVLFVIILVWQILVWSRSYISIQDNTLVVERNTINKKKNTIGLKNISNVNLEQNLFEMVLGTCKVKLDTNSLSTADQTDVKIVLKKKDAEAFRLLILRKEETPKGSDDLWAVRGFASKIDDIIMHGIFSLNFSSVLAGIGAVLGGIGFFADLSVEDFHGDLMGTLLTILIAVWLLGGILWNVIKGFVKYLDFKVERKDNKILLNYGILKKVAYSIPVDKINAVRFTQTGIARLGKRYMVEIINVGLDDDENENQSFFLPYGTREKIEKQMELLLPEFADCFEIQEEREPKSIWVIWIPKALISLGVLFAVFGFVAEFAPEGKGVALAVIGVIAVFVTARKLIAYFTRGVAVDERYLKLVTGAVGKVMLYVKYDKIQYVTLKQNVIAKHFGVQKGYVYVLAAMKNQVHDVPYFAENKLEKLKGKLL